ncbi:MAG: hypothetical protein RML33_11310, partial [Acidobacteriota bacterium]|nr:hypothetical protein [Acidobacteriota bacterium]
MNMLVAGKLSGIQDFIFDVKMEGGAQAKRLRARSFFVQVLTEVLYLRTADFLEVEPKQAQVFCGAGKFLLSGEARNVSRLNLLEREVNEKLLRDAAGRLSFSCAWFESEGAFKDSYERVMKRLSFRKKQPFKSVFSKGGDWDKKSLRLQSITPPCDLCEQEKAEKTEEGYGICKTCWMMRR